MLHPVLTEFQELIDADPVVRMYVSQMIAQVPGTKPYRKRHLDERGAHGALDQRGADHGA